MKKLALAIQIILFISSCVTTPKKAKNKKSKKQVMTASTDVALQIPPAASPTPVPEPVRTSSDDPCIPQEQLGTKQPWVAGKTGFVVTGVTKTCKTSDDKPGIASSSDLILMGVPCSHGEGRIDWKGSNYQKPKMVSFLLDTNCAFMPENLQPILQDIRNTVGATTHKGRILAVNPLSVQYWKLDDFDDEDPAPYIEFRSNLTLDKTWTQLVKGEAINVTLLGRENAWSSNNAFYEVRGALAHTAKNRFSLRVRSIKILNDDERKAYETKCETLKPKRDCSSLK